jgi:hypothetical protein
MKARMTATKALIHATAQREGFTAIDIRALREALDSGDLRSLAPRDVTIWARAHRAGAAVRARRQLLLSSYTTDELKAELGRRTVAGPRPVKITDCPSCHVEIVGFAEYAR